MTIALVKPPRAMAQHSSSTPEWGTPRVAIDLAHRVLGRIDLDPFSNAAWNESVRALWYLTADDNSFACRWLMCGPTGSPAASAILGGEAPHTAVPLKFTALVNPPGDKRGQAVKDAWRLTEWHHRTGWLGGGVIWVAFNIGQLATLQMAPRSPLHPDFLRCIPRKRLDYDKAPGVKGGAPPHASALVLMPALDPAVAALQRGMFTGIAGEIGEVF